MQKTFEQYREEMNPCYKDRDAFLNRESDICYIPENAESLEDAFTFNDLFELCEEWANNNIEYMVESNITVGELVENMFDNLSWEFPSTFLNGLDY